MDQGTSTYDQDGKGLGYFQCVNVIHGDYRLKSLTLMLADN